MIGRSKVAACFGSSAGARLTTIRSFGLLKPELTIARATRCVLSRIAASGSPTSTVAGRAPPETSTSTSTGTASIPNRENVWSLASMIRPFWGCFLSGWFRACGTRRSQRGQGAAASPGGRHRRESIRMSSLCASSVTSVWRAVVPGGPLAGVGCREWTGWASAVRAARRDACRFVERCRR